MSELLPAGTPATGRRRRPSGEPPPLPRQLDKVAIGFMIAFCGWALVWLWIFLSDDPAIWITARDLELMAPIVDHRQDWLTPPMQRMNDLVTHWATPLVGWTVIVLGLGARRIRHVLLLIASLSVVAAVTTVISIEIGRPRPLGVTQIGDWEGFAQPSRPIGLVAVALTAGALTLLPPGRWRTVWYGATIGFLALVGFAQVYVGVDHPSDVLVAATVGVAVPLVLYRVVAPEAVFPVTSRPGNTAHLDITGARGDAIRLGMRQQLGIEVTDIAPIGLAGSAGSTPLRIGRADGPDLFAKLYARNHLRSDRAYKLFRTLLYGRLEDEQRFTSVRRLIQHEDYMLHLMRSAGVDCMEPIGIVEITPDREYLLVAEFLEGATEVPQSDVTTEVIDAGLAAVAELWRAGLAHRDIKPSNVMVQGSRVRLIDVAFGQVRPSPWREAVDLANMMLVLALASSPELVYERALLQFDESDIAEAFAAARGVTLPSQLRAEVKRDGRQLVERFRELAPTRAPVAIQRWSVRRAALTGWVVLVAVMLAAVFFGSLPDIGLA